MAIFIVLTIVKWLSLKESTLKIWKFVNYPFKRIRIKNAEQAYLIL